MWSSGQDMGSGARWLKLFISFLSACWPTQLQSHSTQDPVMADWLPGCPIHYAFIDKKGVIVLAVCPNNERVNMSQVFPQSWGRGSSGWGTPPLLPDSSPIYPSASVSSSLVAPLSPGPPRMVMISAQSCWLVLTSMLTRPAMDPVDMVYGSSMDHFQHMQKNLCS